jgi:anti-anti-sigma regulatory factor
MIIDGEISVKNINNFYSSLKEEVENNNQVVLDFSNSSRIDASTAQAILAAITKAKEMDKTIRFIGISPGMKKLLKLAGIKM